MIAKLTEFENIIEKLEALIKNLKDDRDRAWDEVERVKKIVDQRELELLQLDEEIQREAKRFEERMQALVDEREDAEKKLDELGARIRDLLPLLPENGHEEISDIRPSDEQ